MSDARRPNREPARAEAPLWRQAAEGIGIVVLFAAVVAAAGIVLSVIVSLFF